MGGSVVKIMPANAGYAGAIPGLGRSPGEENSNPLQYSCLGNPMDRGAWRATDHGVAKSRTQLSDNNTLWGGMVNTFLEVFRLFLKGLLFITSLTQLSEETLPLGAFI